MGSPRRLTDGEIDDALAGLEGWSLERGKLHKEYRFADFVQAFAFMTRVAAAAEERAHHPEWFNVYSTVRVDLTTHDAGGISQRDVDLAREMDRLQSG